MVTERARVIKNSTAREDSGLVSLLVHHGPSQWGGLRAREHLAAALQHLALGWKRRAGARLVSAARELLGHCSSSWRRWRPPAGWTLAAASSPSWMAW